MYWKLVNIDSLDEMLHLGQTMTPAGLCHVFPPSFGIDKKDTVHPRMVLEDFCGIDKYIISLSLEKLLGCLGAEPFNIVWQEDF